MKLMKKLVNYILKQTFVFFLIFLFPFLYYLLFTFGIDVIYLISFRLNISINNRIFDSMGKVFINFFVPFVVFLILRKISKKIRIFFSWYYFVASYFIFFFILLFYIFLPDIEERIRVFLFLRNHQYPQGYKECLSLVPFSEKKNVNYYNFKCQWSTSIEEKGLFQACLESGGYREKEIYLRHLGTVPETCWLTFYNPDYHFPGNYNECAAQTNRSLTQKYCEISVSLSGAYTGDDTTERLFQECQKFGHMPNIENISQGKTRNCILRYYKNEQ